MYLYAGGFPQTVDPGVNFKLISSGNVSITSGVDKTISVSNGDISTSSSAQIRENSIIFAVNGTRMLAMQRDTTANTNKIVVDGVVPIELCSGSSLSVIDSNSTTQGVDKYTNTLTSQSGLMFSRSGTRWGSKTYDVSLYSDVNTINGKAYLCTTNSPAITAVGNELVTASFVRTATQSTVKNAFSDFIELYVGDFTSGAPTEGDYFELTDYIFIYAIFISNNNERVSQMIPASMIPNLADSTYPFYMNGSGASSTRYVFLTFNKEEGTNRYQVSLGKKGTQIVSENAEHLSVYGIKRTQ